jgi:tetratricopeptide (TPR) repeat protein
MRIFAILMVLWQAVAANAGALDDCLQAQSVDRRIQGCTDRIRQFPGDATALFNRGAAYLSKGDLDRAIADNTAVIQLNPAFAAAYYHRGIAYGSREQYDPAIADFSAVVGINPRHGGALDARARIYLKTYQHLLALRDAERAVSLDPVREEFLDTRAHVYEALGRTHEAVADYRRVLAGNASMASAIDGLKRLSASPSALHAPATAVRKAKSRAKAHLYTAPRAAAPETTQRDPQTEIECERARHLDPAGQYAGYPCWARGALRWRP